MSKVGATLRAIGCTTSATCLSAMAPTRMPQARARGGSAVAPVRPKGEALGTASTYRSLAAQQSGSIQCVAPPTSKQPGSLEGHAMRLQQGLLPLPCFDCFDCFDSLQAGNRVVAWRTGRPTQLPFACVKGSSARAPVCARHDVAQAARATATRPGGLTVVGTQHGATATHVKRGRYRAGASPEAAARDPSHSKVGRGRQVVHVTSCQPFTSARGPSKTFTIPTTTPANIYAQYTLIPTPNRQFGSCLRKPLRQPQNGDLPAACGHLRGASHHNQLISYHDRQGAASSAAARRGARRPLVSASA